jgi:hypothetical protein
MVYLEAGLKPSLGRSETRNALSRFREAQVYQLIFD